MARRRSVTTLQHHVRLHGGTDEATLLFTTDHGAPLDHMNLSDDMARRLKRMLREQARLELSFDTIQAPLSPGRATDAGDGAPFRKGTTSQPASTGRRGSVPANLTHASAPIEYKTAAVASEHEAGGWASLLPTEGRIHPSEPRVPISLQTASSHSSNASAQASRLSHRNTSSVSGGPRAVHFRNDVIGNGPPAVRPSPLRPRALDGPRPNSSRPTLEGSMHSKSTKATHMYMRSSGTLPSHTPFVAVGSPTPPDEAATFWMDPIVLAIRHPTGSRASEPVGSPSVELGDECDIAATAPGRGQRGQDDPFRMSSGFETPATRPRTGAFEMNAIPESPSEGHQSYHLQSSRGDRPNSRGPASNATDRTRHGEGSRGPSSLVIFLRKFLSCLKEPETGISDHIHRDASTSRSNNRIVCLPQAAPM